jgi:hypothetical protein
MPTNFQRLIALFKSEKKSDVTDFSPPDPAIEFPHPENASLFRRFRGDSTIGIPGVMGGYETRTHPDLTSIVYDLIADPAVRKGYAFGRPVMATPTGLVFAYADGTHYIFLKLGEERFDDARQDGGRFDPSYGKGWIEFRLGGRVGSSQDWREAMARWATISYQDSVRIG